MTVERIHGRTDWPTLLTAETLLMGLLGKILYTYPDRGWLEPLVEPGFFAESPLPSEQPLFRQGLALLHEWNESQNGRLAPDVLDDLRTDYTRLFIGPGKVLAAPWESVHFSEERLTFQQETLQVRDWYRRFGLEAVNLYHEPDDHIGLEVAFLAHLATLALSALEADRERFGMLLAAQRDFLRQHPLRWVAAWQEQVTNHAQTDFYRGAACLVRGALLELEALLAREPAGNGSRAPISLNVNG
jgi:putative dimethyl sulfoxide reductase chaperone